MAKELQLALLGDLRLTLAGTPLTGFDSNKARALLCYLAVTGRPHYRPALTGLLWGNMPETQAKTNLRVVLSNLRKLVGAHLTITRQTVTFNQDNPYRLDVEDFLTNLNLTASEPDIEHLRAAVELYRGDFLEGFYVREAPEFEEWVLVQRERFRELALNTLHTLVLHYMDQGQAGYAAAIDYTTRLLALDPWREEAHRQLMLLLARNGQRSAALTQYQTCRRILARELDVPPMPETTALYERIRAIDPARHHNLPVQPTAFVGREEELAKIAIRLSNPACRLLTILGPGGIGKTRLALEAATAQIGRFFEGVYFISVAAVENPNLLVSTIADALKLSFAGPEDPKAQLLNYLRQKEMLLVLDNFEHLLDGANLLAEILQVSPELKFLVTSRERLNLRGEWLLEIEGLQFPALPAKFLPDHDEYVLNEKWEVIETYSAIRLFLQSAGQIQAEFSPVEQEQPWLVRICQMVEGIPLGLELAAAWVRTHSCQEIAREIERNLNFLATSLRDVPDRHRSLQAVFDHSWRLLSAEEKTTFRKLSVFRGGFRREAAEKVTGASLLTLSALVDKSLLRRNASDRYDIHELLRQYVSETFQQFPQEQTKTQDLHCHYYANFLRQQEIHLKGKRQQDTLEKIHEEIENVRAGWLWAIEQKKLEQIGESLESLYLFYDVRGWFQEGVEAFEKAAQRFKTLPAKDKESRLILGRVLARQGSLYHRFAHYKQATQLIEKSLSIFNNSGARADVAFSLGQLGNVTRLQGEHTRAKQLLSESLTLYREINNRWGMAQSLNWLGVVVHLLGNYAETEQLLAESLAVYRELEDKEGIARVLHNLGALARDTGNYHQADQFYQECLTLSQELGNLYLMAYTFNHLAGITMISGNYPKAEELYQESLALGKKIGDQRVIAYCLYDLSCVAYELEEYQEVQQLLQEALAIFKEIGDRWGVASSLGNLGEVTRTLGARQQSKLYFVEALRLAMNIQAIPIALEILVKLAPLFMEGEDAQPEWALELLTLVYHHPASSGDDKERAERLLTQLETELPPQIMETAKERGRMMSLDTAVAKVLEELRD